MNTQASRRNPDDLPSDEEFFLTERAPQETPVSNPPRPFASETPGAQIKAIREAQKVSVEEVAKRLYLDIQMVKNLEADNYAHLPPPIFVQGYLRAFAKLFNVSEEPLLAAYLKYNPNSNSPPALASENTAQMPKVGVGHHNSAGRWWFYMTWILLLGLTVLIAWRYAMQPHAPHSDTPQVENTTAPAITPPNISTNSMPYTPPSEGGGTKPSTPSTALSTPPATGTTPPPVAMTSLPPTTGTTPPSATGTTPPPATTPSPDAGTTPTPPVVTPSEDTNALILKFKDVSWARVVDSTKKKLYDGTSKPGQTITIKEGVPPYEVSLNKVSTVDLFYKGQLMDLKPFKDQRSPTLSVGNAPKGSAAAQEEEEEE